MSRLTVLAAALLAACAGTNPATTPAARSAGTKLYVVNQSGASVSVIDQERLVVDTVLDLQQMGFSANARPHHVAVEKDGSFWYVSLIGDGRVLKLDRMNHVVGQVRMETPGLLAIDPAHDTLYVGRSMTAPNPPKSLGVIKRSTFAMVDEQEIVISRPHALVVSQDGRWAHAASLAENRIASVDSKSGQVALTTLPGAPRSMVQFTISPDGKHMIVGGELSNSVIVFDLTTTPPFTPAREFAVGGKPWDPVFSPDGKHAYFSLFGDNAIAEIDYIAGTVTRRFTGGFAQPYDMIMRNDGKYLFVVNQNTGATPRAGESAHAMMDHGTHGSASSGWLSVVNVATGKVEKNLMLGAGPTGAGAAGAR